MSGLETLALISMGVGGLGAAVQAQGTIAAGKAAQQSANYEAQQLDLKAKEEQAAAQRDALELRHKKDLTLSELQANSAASGFSATDPTALALADEITKYGTVQEQMAMYGGASRREGLEAQAAGRRMEGKAARQGAAYSAAGTILGGISSMADKYRRPSYAPSGSYYG